MTEAVEPRTDLLSKAVASDESDMTFDHVSLEGLRKRRSAKWSMYPGDVLPSSNAEMDFPSAPVIAEAVAAAVGNGDLGYAHAQNSGLADAFANFAQRQWGWVVDPGAVTAVPDVMVGVVELLRLLTSPEGGVVINTPVYPPFFSIIAEAKRRVVEVPMVRTQEGWHLPLDGIRTAFEGGAEVLLLCNPHNPTGYVADGDVLTELAAIASAHDAIVLSDEIHAPLTLPGATHIPYCSVPLADEHSIVLTSASKAWNIPGLKCAVAAAGSERMRGALQRLPIDVADRVGHLGVIASMAAFNEGQPWLDRLLTYLDETRRWFPGFLADRLPGIGYEPGRATYLAWLDCRKLGLGDDPAEIFLEQGRVGLSPGPDFGAPGGGFARLNLGTSRSLIEEAVNRMVIVVG